MDFIRSLSRTSKQHDSIMVVVDMLNNVVHFILVKYTNSSSEVSQILIREIMRLHRIPKKIISDKDAKFTSRFWKELSAGLRKMLASIQLIFHK